MRSFPVVLAVVACTSLSVATSVGLLTPGQRFKARRAVDTVLEYETEYMMESSTGSSSTSQNGPMGCSGLSDCSTCVTIPFCLWGKSGGCVADTSVEEDKLYSYYKGSCDHLAGDWLDASAPQSLVAGAAQQGVVDGALFTEAQRADSSMTMTPLMMQPPAIANTDEANIFQGAFPRPNYGFGALGYKAQGMDPYAGYAHNSNFRNTPMIPCKDQPLVGCLEKPVIVPLPTE